MDEAVDISDDLAGYYDLGTYHRPVTTASAAAQTWFDRGLVWTYGFNHEEAVRCFERAAAADPGCAMAHWGVAYALGPNYNKPWEFFDETDLASTVERTHAAVARAREAAAHATPLEQALVEALAARYPADRPAGDLSVWNHDYAGAMRAVHARFGDDLDVATLFADALMNLTPWALWDLRTGEPAPGSHAVEARAVLDGALTDEAGRTHPGLLHMYIHLMEMSTTPEQALPVADRLRGLVPDAGHLEHMPTHLDVLCGRYGQVVASNTAAVAADERYLAREGAMNFYTLYRSHDYHFAVYGAMFQGRSQVALEMADRLAASIPEDLLRVQVPPMADWLEGFLAMRVHVLIRFGRWEQILDLPLPADPDLYCVSTAMTHYARGVAFSATGRVDAAEQERTAFRAASDRVPESRTLFNNTCRDILAVAGAMLDGELEYRRGRYDEAYAHLRRSIDLDDALPYDEPWGWMQPTRHAYGALLLEQGHVEEAAAVYRADLGLDDTLPRALQHPENVWSLHGYHECLLRLGRAAEAAQVAPRLAAAVAEADVPVTASCFCRGGPPPSTSDDCCR
ncbi:tetratricopeptide repeat protein [Kineosporia sp. R_H_3]|uniref:tetratricopeptide repeat protein n=1 Tax=Kineosporia sp. R_H_3 TaxID=1961848 RepID=UPI001E603D80|nr:tetratricopeptide repeat protein [Kineosporia sp. R_H_3]